jgi:hypothetical protein
MPVHLADTAPLVLHQKILIDGQRLHSVRKISNEIRAARVSGSLRNSQHDAEQILRAVIDFVHQKPVQMFRLHNCFSAFDDALLQRVVQFAQLRLDETPLRDFRRQRAVCALQLALLEMKLDKHTYFRTQDRRIDGLEKIVDRATVVAFDHMFVFVVERGKEDDRDFRCLLALLDHLGKFKTGDAGHLHIEDQHREFFSQQRQKRILGGLSFNQTVSRIVQDGLEDRQILRLVIDDQDVDEIKSGRDGQRRAHRLHRSRMFRKLRNAHPFAPTEILRTKHCSPEMPSAFIGKATRA